MSTIDTSSQPIDPPSKPSSKWKSTSSTSSTASTQKPPRKVDRELQRIKSLAVVSGLNKQFSQEPQSMSPIPSISTTTSGASSGGGGGGYSNHYHHSHYVSHRPATVCGLSSDMRPYGARSQRSSSISSSHSRHSMTKSKATTTTTMSNQRVKKAIELDELEKELLNMFEQAYLQRSQEQRVDNWVVSVMPPASDICSVDDAAAAAHMDDNTPPATTPPDDARVAKRSSSRLSLGRDSIISEVGQQQRIRELESLYMATLKKLNQSEQHHTQWEQRIQQTIAAYIEEKEMEADRARQLAEVVVKQELIMEQMELHMHQVTAAAAAAAAEPHTETTEEEQEQAKHTLHQLKSEIQELRDTRTAIENDISVLRRELDAEQRLLEQTWETSQALTAECNEQRVQITEKLDTLKRQVMDKDMLLHKVYLTHRDVVPERPARNSNRDSKQQQPPQQQRRSTATPRWTGGPLPPQAPPPTDPLPPVPLSPPPSQQPQSSPEEVLSNSSKRPSISSSAGGASSCFEDPETEAAYREFAEQLQSRLSVSKEIDDLRVWQPADLDEFQKRMSRWSDMDEEDLKRHSLASSLRSKEGAAFWRGMKKKLRV